MQDDPLVLLAALRDWFKKVGTVMVAYSGGVDSALLMAVAHQAIGEKALACIGTSPSLPERELNDALELARRVGANVRVVKTEEMLDEHYASNPDNRCFYCKNELFGKLEKIASDEKIAVIVDGNNASDLGDYRPGRDAAKKHEVRSPLVELGITKEQIRAMAKVMNLPVWDKPAMACLASRVPHGTPIMPGLLQQIERAENVLAALGFKQFRVRHHGEIARVELPPEDFARAVEMREAIVSAVREAGYRFVTLDLAGFRSGGMNGAKNETHKTKTVK